MKRLVMLLLTVVVLSLFEVNDKAQTTAGASTQRNSSAQAIETGKFRIYETKQLRGEESYEINRSSDGSLVVQAKIDLPFMGEEKKPSLTALLQTKPDLTPKSFETKGIRPLEIEINTSITVQGRTATVHDGNNASKSGGPSASTTQVPLPENFFTLAGYLPVTMEMMLVRYWLEHGRKNSIALLPGGEAFIEFRGRDTVTLSGKLTTLDRYHLSGNKWPGGWGRQTLWFDRQSSCRRP